ATAAARSPAFLLFELSLRFPRRELTPRAIENSSAKNPSVQIRLIKRRDTPAGTLPRGLCLAAISRLQSVLPAESHGVTPSADTFQISPSVYGLRVNLASESPSGKNFCLILQFAPKDLFRYNPFENCNLHP